MPKITSQNTNDVLGCQWGVDLNYSEIHKLAEFKLQVNTVDFDEGFTWPLVEKHLTINLPLADVFL